MERELVIQSSKSKIEVALLEDKKLVELHHDDVNNRFNVGDVYLGRVKKVISGLNAAFVDIGSEKDAFLHYTDLSPDIKSILKLTKLAHEGKLNDFMLGNFTMEEPIEKNGSITKVLKPKDLLLVQILKEPIASKGPRLTCELTIPGRNLVLSPFTSKTGISKKIANPEERKRLKVLVESLKPKAFGIVVRTVAQNKKAGVLHGEITLLVDQWKQMLSNVKGAEAPLCVFTELDRSTSIVRDLLNDTFSKISCNDKSMTHDLTTYVKQIAPDRKNMISYYSDSKPLFDHYGVTKQIKSAFGKTVTMNSGAYIIIEHTEALHVIDVNSGNKFTKDKNQDAGALAVNLEAAEEIARQLRLRDMGGIIVIDFIDMKSADYRKKVYDHLKECMNNDRATHSVLPLTKLNLAQVTRERVRPEINIVTSENCPSCEGTGRISPSLLLVEEMERNIKLCLTHNKKISIVCHPYIEAFLKKGIISRQVKWYFHFHSWIKISSNAAFSLTQLKYFNQNNDEIKLKD